VLTEILSHLLKKGLVELAHEYEDILLNSTGFHLMPVDVVVARLAADLRARYNLTTPDALHLATAIEAGCEAFLTNDLDLRRVEEIRVPALDDLEVDGV
jgi:predicted nucleic acid-binding protein